MISTLRWFSLLPDSWLRLAHHQATIGVSESGLKAMGNLAGPNSLSPSVGSYALGPQGLGNSDSAGISPCSRAQLLLALPRSQHAYASASHGVMPERNLHQPRTLLLKLSSAKHIRPTSHTMRH